MERIKFHRLNQSLTVWRKVGWWGEGRRYQREPPFEFQARMDGKQWFVSGISYPIGNFASFVNFRLLILNSRGKTLRLYWLFGCEHLTLKRSAVENLKNLKYPRQNRHIIEHLKLKWSRISKWLIVMATRRQISFRFAIHRICILTWQLQSNIVEYSRK